MGDKKNNPVKKDKRDKKDRFEQFPDLERVRKAVIGREDFSGGEQFSKDSPCRRTGKDAAGKSEDGGEE